MDSIGLYFYGSRWFDPSIMRWTSPDSIIPDQYNPLDWDRYAFVRNNPLKFVDPSGNRPEGACEFGCYAIAISQHTLKNKARQDILISKILRGSGSGGKWTHEDWRFYSENRDEIWNGEIAWTNPDTPGWEGFSIHVERLATLYGEGEDEQFLRDFALVFGGISYDTPWGVAAYESRHGPAQPFNHEGNQGLDPDYLDSLGRRQNQSHHYAGIFFLGYYAGPQASSIIELGRDSDNPGDLRLGGVAARHGYYFSLFMDPSLVSIVILSLLNSP